jgi:hypothetical protein
MHSGAISHIGFPGKIKSSFAEGGGFGFLEILALFDQFMYT